MNVVSIVRQHNYWFNLLMESQTNFANPKMFYSPLAIEIAIRVNTKLVFMVNGPQK